MKRSLRFVVYTTADCLRYNWLRKSYILPAFWWVVIGQLFSFAWQQKWSCTSASVANNPQGDLSVRRVCACVCVREELRYISQTNRLPSVGASSIFFSTLYFLFFSSSCSHSSTCFGLYSQSLLLISPCYTSITVCMQLCLWFRYRLLCTVSFVFLKLLLSFYLALHLCH